MNLSYLNNYFSDKSLNKDAIQLYYDFDQVSGVFLKNKIYENEVQFYPVAQGFSINKKYSPAFFNTKYGQVNFTGSGVFQGTNTMQIFEESTSSDNSLFINFGRLNCNKNFTLNGDLISIPTGKIQTLSYIKSKNNTNPFQIILGLNDANDLTLEFSGGTESYKTVTPKELSFQNICCLKFGRNILELNYYDIIENETHKSRIDITGNYFEQNKQLYIGNVGSGFLDQNYTGFFGTVDDILLLNNIPDDAQSFGLAKLFIKTGEYIDVVNLTGLTFNVISNAYLNPTGIIGVGINGYQDIKIEEALVSGSLTGIYIQSGITGNITGETIEIQTSTESVISNTGQIITKYELYDEKYSSNFTKDNIIFNKKTDDQDIFEIQFYLDSQIKISHFDYSNVSDIYVAKDNVSDKNNSIYINGVRLVSGINYEYTQPNVFITNDYPKGDSNDLVFYTVSSLTGNKVYQTDFNRSSASGDYYLAYSFSDNNSNWGRSNIFLNGQKLISGFNYLIAGQNLNNLYLYKDLPTGSLTIVKDNFISGVTGNNTKIYNSSLKYNNEQIWLNGIYQYKGIDYILSSCYNSLMSASGDIEVKENYIFNNEYYRFNL